MRRFILVATALLLTASSAFAQRLPAGVTPTHYTLWFAPDLDKATFRGRESIAVTLTEPTSTVTLHAAEITFGEVKIDDASGSQTATVSVNEKEETATFKVARPVSKGAATVH